jgi:hypothetical protein
MTRSGKAFCGFCELGHWTLNTYSKREARMTGGPKKKLIGQQYDKYGANKSTVRSLLDHQRESWTKKTLTFFLFVFFKV